MNTIKKGFTLVELLVVIAILGMLMGALFPAISGAMLNAQTAAMQGNGRDLVNAINSAANDNNQISIWPRTKDAEESEGGGDRIYQQTFSDADKYFEALFDLQTVGTDEHDAYIDDNLLQKLGGAGVSSYKGNKSLAGCVAWKVAADTQNVTADNIAMLVSRNVTTDNFPSQGTVQTSSQTKKLTVDTQFPTPFGPKAMVVAFKSGSAQVFKGRNMSISDIFNKTPVVIPQTEQITYLKPTAK